VFSLWPTLDLTVSAWFYQAPGNADWQGFVGDRFALVGLIHEILPWLGRAVCLLALVAAACWRFRPGPVNIRWWRRSVSLGLAMLLGTGIVVNVILKETWGRPRPVEVQTFGGAGTFVPALHPSRQCDSNCSFVSGHSATGFTLMALGLLGAPATRRRWLFWGFVAGLVTGALRIVQGGHFLSDVLFSGVVVWQVCLLLREVWVRLRLRRRRCQPRVTAMQVR
jgi:lipid A 4'-phosphatase